jgi:hypothetical protein
MLQATHATPGSRVYEEAMVRRRFALCLELPEDASDTDIMEKIDTLPPEGLYNRDDVKKDYLDALRIARSRP